jgi:hypothetical protein
VKEPRNIKILRTTPAEGWLAVYAVPAEEGRATIERERINTFAVCEDEEGNRFVSGIGEDGELCVLRDDFVGHFSVKAKPIKIREEAMSFVRTKKQKRGELL